MLEDDLDAGVAEQRKELEEIEKLFPRLQDELYNATRFFGRFRNAHEGYAVLLEEVDELWDEVKKKRPSRVQLRKEALQVAAMALRFAADLT